MMSDLTAGNIYASVFPKICSIIILPVASAIAGIIPLKLGKKFYKTDGDPAPPVFEKTMSFFLYFGGGVLLCTIFLHLLPEIRETVDELETKGVMRKFVLSFPELVLCIGFFLMFSIEEIVHNYLLSPDEPELSKSLKQNDTEKVFVVEKSESCLKINKEEDGSMSGTEQEHINNVFDGNKNYHSCTGRNCHSLEHGLSTHSLHQVHIDHEHSHLPDMNKSVFYGLLTVIALSVHELFEGLAVGLEPKASMVWYLLTAISCHKVVLAGFIGVQLLITQVKSKIAYLYVLAFASTSPIGILAGLFMSTNAPINDTIAVASVTLQSMATGTLLYIVFFEVYAKKFGTYKLNGVTKVLSSVFGFLFMAFLQVQLAED